MSIFIIPAILLFSISAANAQTPLVTNANSKEILAAEFKAEYAEHKKLASAEEWGASLVHARKAYELGKQLFDPNDKNNESLKIYEIALGDKSPELVDVLLDLARANIAVTERIPEEYFNRSIEISSGHYGSDSLEHGRLLATIGAELLHHGLLSSGQKYVLEGYELLKKYAGENHPDTAFAAFNLGKYDSAKNNHVEAIEYFKKVLASISTPGNPTSKLELFTHSLLVNSYEKLGQRDLATQHCIAIGKMTPSTPDQDVQPLYRTAPDYPRGELDRGKSGYAVIEFDIYENGFVINAHSLESNGKNFETAAIKSVEEWRYAPAFIDGKPVIRKNVVTKTTFEVE